MPHKDKTARRRAVRAAVRRTRLFNKALAAGHPLAVAADKARRPMDPVWAFEARLTPLTKAEREPYRAEYMRLKAECQAACDGKHERYLALREQALAVLEAEAAELAL